MRISDGSSDVCSSVLADRAREEGADTEQRTARLPFVLAGLAAVLAGWLAAGIESPRLFDATVALLGVAALIGVLPFGQIGRASCRERVCQSVEISVVAGTFQQTK